MYDLNVLEAALDFCDLQIEWVGVLKNEIFESNELFGFLLNIRTI